MKNQKISLKYKIIQVLLLLYLLAYFNQELDFTENLNMESTSASNLKGLIIGASGAIGRELVRELCKSKNWSEVTVIVRREIEAWSQIEGKEKLKVVKVESLDDIQKHQ